MKNKQNILHIDMDNFFVSVERLQEPTLQNKPVIVGGKTNRGVVASCSYEARKFGVHSAMPIALAKRLCPEGIYLSGNMDSYSKYSKIVTEIIAEKAPLFEKASIDEFYLDFTGMDTYFNVQKWAEEIRQKVIRETGLPLSAGLSFTKTISKIATGEAKPNNSIYVPETIFKPFLNPLPIGKMPMVGDKTEKILKNLGVSTIGMLMDMQKDLLLQILGNNGLSLWRCANGLESSPIIPFVEAKSMGVEKTFSEDTTDIKFLNATLISMVEKLAFEMRQEGKMTGCLSIKIKYSDFETASQQSAIPFTYRDDILIEKALTLFKKLYSRRVLLRLVGVKFSNLIHSNYQMRLFEDGEKPLKMMFAIDKIKKRYGTQSVVRASGISRVEWQNSLKFKN